MKIKGLVITKGGHKVKNLIINESGTVIIGKIEDGLSEIVIEETGKFETKYKSTKWTINEKRTIAVSQLELTEKFDGIFDLDLKGANIPPLLEIKVKRNFYSFHKDAWHCKLYKWVFGVDAWKAHKTMCPYWWTMVVVVLFIWAICVFKLGGKWSSDIMESMRTYKYRKNETKRQKQTAARKILSDNFLTLFDNFDEMTPEEAWEIMKGTDYSEFKYNIPYSIQNKFYDKVWIHDKYIINLKHIEEDKKYKLNELKLAEKELVIKRKENFKEIKYKQYEEIKDNKFVKVVGMLLIIISVLSILYGLGLVLIKLYEIIPWMILLKAVAVIGIFIISVYLTYLLIKFIIAPVFSFLCFKIKIGCDRVNVKTKEQLNKLPKINFSFKKINKFLFGWVKPIIQFIAKSFVYMLDFFIMSKDLLYAIYKKNCPTITWLDEEDELK